MLIGRSSKLLAVVLVLGITGTATAQFDTDHNHLQCYPIRGDKVKKTVVVADQWGTSETVVVKPALLCLPTDKRPAPFGPALDPDPVDPAAVYPFKCYKVKPGNKQNLRTVSVTDQFGTETVKVRRRSSLLCAPATVDVTPCCPVCGDGACGGDEISCNCSSDCPPLFCTQVIPTCGNGVCELGAAPGESHERCPEDCPLACVPCP